ncbi:Mur ligase family protein [Conexibacter sp. CPCC 206217]|uniref:Mur ligase family protein n=1 Tax=Conexibacter sp. CPCC 206217 TaxID=3064574 RepID=UPI00271CD613|nr:Mur ligase family protein [Conexibacter sp. CPCC 206217]MDO8210563.1 Mur ligase family protein [Conexibacter sp. CPCC 206217]
MASRTLGPKLLIARTVGALARRAGRGGGTSLPGKVLMKLEPHAIGALARRLPQGSIAISATNGKTTTAAMVASILERRGTRLVHNRAGANMAGGIASTLMGAARGKGIDGQLGLFEVDEFWLGQLVSELRPRKLLLGNLFRDQLDRYGELETIADRWAEIVAVHGRTTELVLNADDPLVADLGRQQPRVIYFGVEDDSLALAQMQHASDSKHCRRCGHAYEYDAVYLGHLGRYHCPQCGQRRPDPGVIASQVTLRGTRGAHFTLTTPAGVVEVELPLPGLYNVYNALAAAALAHSLGVPLPEIVAGLEHVAAAFGRAETIRLDGREMSILLIKNPAGANEVLRTLALEPEQVDLLAVLNDNVADGRDISWVWDADFELLAGRLRRVTCSGTRAAELALRLKYAGVAPERIVVVPGLEAALDEARLDGDGTLFALPTYTALLSLKDLLSQRGLAPEYWR